MAFPDVRTALGSTAGIGIKSEGRKAMVSRNDPEVAELVGGDIHSSYDVQSMP
jgi:hypothetical protein